MINFSLTLPHSRRAKRLKSAKATRIYGLRWIGELSKGKIESGEEKRSDAKVIIPLFPQQTDAQTNNCLGKIPP